MRNGQHLSYFIIILEGKGKMEVLGSKGRVVSLMEFNEQDLLASDVLFAEKAFPVDIVAESKTKALIVNREKCLELPSSKPLLLKNFLKINAEKTSNFTKKLNAFLFVPFANDILCTFFP